MPPEQSPAPSPPASAAGTAFRILSLGAGVQSTTLLLMSIRGKLPRVDAAIFADTQWEPPAVYRHLDWLKGEAAAADIPLHVVTAGNIREDALQSRVRGTIESGSRWASMPLYTFPPGGRRLDDGTADPRDVGMIRRQCTKEYKIVPVRRAIRSLVLNVTPQHRIGVGAVELWHGISQDEAQRMKKSDVAYVVHRYPLIEQLTSPTRRRLFPVGYTRDDCLAWLRANGYPRPPKSACVGCPYHDDGQWLEIKADPAMWEDACSFDEAIRVQGGHRGELFLHETCVPLRAAPLRGGEQSRAGGLAGMVNECDGMCGV